MPRDPDWDDGPFAEHGYYTAQVCLQGHTISSCTELCPDLTAKFCSKCGEATIANCQNAECTSPMRGTVRGDFGTSYDPPAYCHNCGKPYPWTVIRAEALAEAIDELDELQGEEREKLKQSIPDVLKETAKTETAVARFRKAIAKAGTTGGKLLHDVLVKVAAELVVRQIQ